jgi:hypothetical protein
MQEVVGRSWNPDYDPETGELRTKGKGGSRKKKPVNPCLIQLTTFAIRRCR